MRRRSALTATSLTMTLVLGSIELSATSALAQDPAADSQLAEAKALNKEAEIKFQTAEYEAALALWKRAFAILPDSEDTRTIRNALVYNIAEAHIRAYEVSRNPTHLRKAKILLENYRDNHSQLYGDEPAAVQERAQAGERIAQLDQMLADSEAKGEVATPLNDGEPASPVPGPGPAPGPAANPNPGPPPANLTPAMAWEQEVKSDPVLGPKWDKGRSQIVGGIVLTSIGTVFLIGTAGMVVWGAQLRAASELCDPEFDLLGSCSLDGTGAFITGGVLGVIGLGLAAPGIALIAVGASKRREVKELKPKPVGFAPYFNPKRGSGGMTFTLRF